MLTLYIFYFLEDILIDFERLSDQVLMSFISSLEQCMTVVVRSAVSSPDSSWVFV